MGDYSQRVIQQSVMSRVGLQFGDNMLMQYVISLIAITMLGVFTNKMTEWTTWLQTHLKKWFNWETEEPTLKFIVTKYKSDSTLQGATTAVMAWMV